MIEVLALSDKAVREKLLERVRSGEKPVFVSQVRSDRFMRPIPEREPFAALERQFGTRVDQLVIADEGSVEGMWRDPLGDLADRLYPDDRAKAYAAASGYLLLRAGRPLAVVKKRAAADDGWFLQDALHRAGLGVPAPDPAARPGLKKARPERGPHSAGEGASAGRSSGGTSGRDRSASDARSSRSASGGGGRSHRESTADAEPRSGRSSEGPTPEAAAAPQATRSAWEVLGISRDAPRDEAKKAFRTQIALYHPDKVAHLAPEFQQLAEHRTRELLAAWAEVEASYG